MVLEVKLSQVTFLKRTFKYLTCHDNAPGQSQIWSSGWKAVPGGQRSSSMVQPPAPSGTHLREIRELGSCPDHHHEAPEVALRAVVWVYMEQAVLTVILCWGAES